MDFKNLCVFVHWTRVASALEGLSPHMRLRDVPTRRDYISVVSLCSRTAVKSSLKTLRKSFRGKQLKFGRILDGEMLMSTLQTTVSLA